ncbi:hypothetical protein GCM10027592_60820 [Spirosoma flavus]
MKYTYTLFFIVVAFTGCKVNRYYFIAEEPIPLFEFATFSGISVDTVQVGDTIYSTGTKTMSIGASVPVEFKGYRFYSPRAKSRLISQTKVNSKKDASIPGLAYAPRKDWKKLAESYRQDSLYWAEQDRTVWYGQVIRETDVLVDNYAIAKPIHKLPANSVVKIKRYDYSYWLIDVDDKKGYLPVQSIAYFSKSKSPFVRTDYTGRTYDPDDEGGISTRANTPTTGAWIHTGSRGGRYYINSNGNKTYVPRSDSYRSSGGRKR